MTAQEAPSRFGAHDVVDALVDAGVTVFFSNPGTSEIHLVSAIDTNEKARSVLCLFEGVATGAADGYARATGNPAAVLLHLGPGLANGLANLHNAYKARTPMVVLVGEHASSHLRFDSPLRSDLDSLAGYAAKRVFHMHPGDDLGAIMRSAAAECRALPQAPVVVVANADVMWSASKGSASPVAAAPAASAPVAPVAAAAAAVLRSGNAVMLLGGQALSAQGLKLADSIAQATGCALMVETFNARHERGTGVPAVARLPYFREMAVDKLAACKGLVLAGSRLPVAFFGSPGERSELAPPGAEIVDLGPDASALDFLEAIAKAVGAAQPPRAAARAVADLPTGLLIPKAIWAIVNRFMPIGAIVSEEAGVSSVGADDALAGAEPHTWMNLTGGSIGQGLPLALGAGVGRPDAKVFAFQGDGAGMYTVQALWSQAREQADVVNVIFRNDRYAILDHEVKRHGLPRLGPKGGAMFELSRPSLDWVQLAGSMGVRAESVSTAEEFAKVFEQAANKPGPCLIEVILAPPRARA
jgi:acetolactate synthase-1/2/3 large subunit